MGSASASKETKGLGLFSAATGEPQTGIAALASYGRDLAPEMDDPPELPAEVEEVDVEGQKEYTKQRMKSRQGRQSTILG